MNSKIHILPYLIGLAVIITAASSLFHKPLAKPEPLKGIPIRLNDTLSNSMSEIPEVAGLDKRIKKYMDRWCLKGASLAISRNDSLLYAKGYGWADQEKDEKMEPSHILRLASVSKLITATGIMVLQDKGVLNIKDSVFCEGGILDCEPYSSFIKDKNYEKITIEHLLRHQGGFYRDPLFSSRDVKHQLQLDRTPDKYDFIGLVLKRPLRFQPGSWQKYSNFGYLILSEIIEKASGKPYEQFIREDVLHPAGCFDMYIAGNYYEDKRENEVRYYTHEGDGKFIEEFNDSGRMVERCYGGNNIPLLSGAGAWCGSAAEIARLVASIDGRSEVPDIISPEAHAQMIEYFDTETFSLGWNDTHPDKGWSRTGTLSGTTALVRYYPDGECWVLITNTSTYKGPGQARYTEALFRECRQLYSSKLPKRDLFNL